MRRDSAFYSSRVSRKPIGAVSVVKAPCPRDVNRRVKKAQGEILFLARLLPPQLPTWRERVS